MADEQNTQTTQATEQTAALSGGGDPNTSTPENSVQAEKTFTQSEVNALITARLERDRKGQPSKEELAEFHKWQRYSSLVLAKMRAENILKDGIVFNNDYEGDPVAGSVKVPVRDDEVKVGDYDRSAGGDLSESSTVYRPILINREKYVNELIDGYDAASVPDNLVADRLDSAGYSMATTLDRDGASTLISQGTRVNTSAISASTVYSDVVDIRTMMSKANVPNDGRRYLLVTPDIYAAMLKSPLFVDASNLGDDVKQSGAVGKIAGFTVYEWNDDTANLAMIAGHPRYATRVNAWKVPISVNDLKDGNRH